MFLLVLAHPGCPGDKIHRAVKRLCVCMCVCDCKDILPVVHKSQRFVFNQELLLN